LEYLGGRVTCFVAETGEDHLDGNVHVRKGRETWWLSDVVREEERKRKKEGAKIGFLAEDDRREN